MSKKSNQQFISIPHSKVIEQLRYKCEEKGIKLIETEESYTSKSSFISRDEMEKGKASGRRISRGLGEQFVNYRYAGPQQTSYLLVTGIVVIVQGLGKTKFLVNRQSTDNLFV